MRDEKKMEALKKKRHTEDDGMDYKYIIYYCLIESIVNWLSHDKR